jgi:hypothetical protein
MRLYNLQYNRNLANNTEGVKSTTGISNVHLRRRHVRKKGKIGLNQSLYWCASFHRSHFNFFLYLPLFDSVAKKQFLGRKYMGGTFAPTVTQPPPPTRSYAYAVKNSRTEVFSKTKDETTTCTSTTIPSDSPDRKRSGFRKSKPNITVFL